MQRCTWCGDDPLYVAYHDAFMQSTGLVNDHVVSCHRHHICHELGNGWSG